MKRKLPNTIKRFSLKSSWSLIIHSLRILLTLNWVFARLHFESISHRFLDPQICVDELQHVADVASRILKHLAAFASHPLGKQCVDEKVISHVLNIIHSVD